MNATNKEPKPQGTFKLEDFAEGTLIAVGNEYWLTRRSDIVEAIRTQLIEYVRSGAATFCNPNAVERVLGIK